MAFARNMLFLAGGFVLAQVVVISMNVSAIKEDSKEMKAEMAGLRASLREITLRTNETGDRVNAFLEANKS